MGAPVTDSKKRRLSMLDGLASTGAPATPGSMMSSNRALRSARDAVDAHHVWDLDPAEIDDDRFADRLDPQDVLDLRASIEQNGQTVPILVRRHPTETNRYLLVYGRRRLEAIRGSGKLGKVRALIASLDDSAALRAQVSENTGRRDLSYIERALFARELLDSGFGSQAQIAEVLNVTRSAVSMAVSVAKTVGPDLARAIGPAHGIGRPRWEALAKDLAETRPDPADLSQIAQAARDAAAGGARTDDSEEPDTDPSVAAFDAVVRHLKKGSPARRGTKARAKTTPLVIGGSVAGTVRKSNGAVRLDLTTVEEGFADWLDGQAQSLIEELHARWKSGT